MKERLIIFNTENVKAILGGRKTQTRRVITHPAIPNSDIVGFQEFLYVPESKYRSEMDVSEGYYALLKCNANQNCNTFYFRCPYGQVGDRLWIKHRYDLFPIYYKPIVGFEGYCSAGTDGHIYRVDKGEPTILQEDQTSDKGYLAVTLSKPGHRHTHFVHRLIAKTFYGTPPVGLYQYQTRHVDGNNQNNHPSNLDWGTQEDNWADRKYHGGGMGEDHYASKLTHSQAMDIRQSTKSQRQLAYIYNVSQPTIQAVKSERYWQDQNLQPSRNYPAWSGWKSPLFMPHWASRLTLEITEVRVERLQEITESDALAEGCSPLPREEENMTEPATIEFEELWDFLNAKRGYGWDTNPWVWVIKFDNIGARIK